MKDRFYNGFIAGIVGGILPFIINYSSKMLGLTTIVWADFMSTFMMTRKPGNTVETVFFIIVQFIFLGVLGSIFAMILPYATSKRHLLKGAIFGVTVWYILFSIPYLLQLPSLDTAPLKTVFVHTISSLSWGIALAFILKRLDNKSSEEVK